MPRPSLRTRSRKHRRVKSAKGRFRVRYRKEKVGVTQCARCNRSLSGIPRSTPSKISKLPASQRKVGRVYGGNLCPGCVQESLKKVARSF